MQIFFIEWCGTPNASIIQGSPVYTKVNSSMMNPHVIIPILHLTQLLNDLVLPVSYLYPLLSILRQIPKNILSVNTVFMYVSLSAENNYISLVYSLVHSYS